MLRTHIGSYSGLTVENSMKRIGVNLNEYVNEMSHLCLPDVCNPEHELENAVSSGNDG